jgi:peptidylprolyl isomerase
VPPRLLSRCRINAAFRTEDVLTLDFWTSFSDLSAMRCGLLPVLSALSFCLVFCRAGEVGKARPITMAELLASSRDSDWRPLDPQNTLYLELASGRIVIELAPKFAPNHVANVKALAREHYYDGLAILRVQDNYVVQWGDPDADKPAARKIENAKRTLPPEFDRLLDPSLPFTRLPDGDLYAPEVGFSGGFPVARDPKANKMWLAHCYGMVGAGRDTAADSGGGTELYVVIGQAPRHLDRNVTLLGRVVDGIDLLSSLPRGTGPLGFYDRPGQRVPIKAVRIAADIPPAERANLEVLRTDTQLFQDLIESRRNRREEWYHFQAGHIELCNVPVPVRSANVP